MGASRRKLDEIGDADGIKLNSLCSRLGVSYRDARYALARGIIPKGIENEPGRGNHRVFDWNQAFHLAVVLKLKAAGMSTPLAGLVSGSGVDSSIEKHSRRGDAHGARRMFATGNR